MYRIERVDHEEDDVQEILTELHRILFDDGSAMASFDYGAWWLAYCDDEPVGFCGITPSMYVDHTGYLKRAGVLPEHRGHGLQCRFIRIRERYAKQQGWHAVYTETSRTNVNSSNNLIRCGYRLFRPFPPWSSSDCLYWKKRWVPI